MKLWQKTSTTTADDILEFTIGSDRDFDMHLARYDVMGSMAHAEMLHKVGLLSATEYIAINTELESILRSIDEGTFVIDAGCEDVHSYIEALLTRNVGEAGKKIHTARSRNDQVALDIKLFLRQEILEIKDAVLTLFHQLQALSEQHKDILMPGYTHLQVAMPSSFGLWFGAWAESLNDDMELLVAAWNVVNKNPLGSGAGYGSSFPIDRAETTRLLHFSTQNFNSVYAQMARGKTEKIVAMALSSIAATLSRFSSDVCLYMSQNFGFLSFPSHLTTGSSIMPHKKNPDVFELIRARCNRIQALPNELTLLMSNLPSGYHRDMQLTKEMLFPALSSLRSCLSIATRMLAEIRVQTHILDDERYKYLFTVEKINELVNAGLPFREAYVRVGNEVENGTFTYDGTLQHTHQGSIGNLCNAEINAVMQEVSSRIALV
ncbi:MAG: argininosuccinate lyase [Taibaiella sp.]|nr:argininosuccinate lyase [Taibaiella sp.]